MELTHAVTAFSALAHETRLQAFRLLVQAGPGGLAAGVLGKELGIAHNTLSFHLSHLANAGVVESRKEGRSVIYSASFPAMRDLIGFMVRDCCSVEFAEIRRDKRSGEDIIKLSDCC